MEADDDKEQRFTSHENRLKTLCACYPDNQRS